MKLSKITENNQNYYKQETLFFENEELIKKSLKTINNVTEKVYDKNRQFNNTDNRIKTLLKLGYDLTKNRAQGQMYIEYDPYTNNITTNYALYKKKEIIDKKIIKGNFHIPLTIQSTIKKHFNCQTNKSKNRKLKRIEKYKILNKNLSDELLKAINKIDKIQAISRHPFSNIVAIDIDNHNNNPQKSIEALKYISKKYYKYIVYSEMSKEYGFHIFINFNSKMTQRNLETLQEEINCTTLFNNIEVIGAKNKNQIFKLIDSPFYIPIAYDKQVLKIRKLQENEYIDNILNFNYKKNSYDFFKILQSIVEQNKRLNQEKYLSELLKNSTSEIPIWNKRNPKTKDFKDKKNIIDELKSKYPFCAGQRVEYMKKIASACYFYNLSEYEYIEITLSNNIDSKDLSKWSKEKIISTYSEYYNKFCKILSKKESNNCSFQYNDQYYQENYYSNNYYIDNNSLSNILKYLIHSLSDEILNSHILKNMKYNKWIQEYKRITPILLKEIIGSIIFNHFNNKTKNPKSTLTHRKFKLLLKGFQFTRKQAELFKIEHNTTINIYKLFNIIIKNSIFKQIFHNNSGYCYNPNYKFSRQFKLRKNINSNNIYIKIIKNILYYIKEKINNNYIFYTLNNKIKYIMLKVSNIDFEKISFYEFEFA